MINLKAPSGLNSRAAAVAAQSGGAMDEDCAECCTMRLPRYRIYVRSFHPNKIFEETDHWFGKLEGGPWTGDDRGFSLEIAATSRVMHYYDADTAQMPRWFKTIKPIASSDPSHAIKSGKVSTYPQKDTRVIDCVTSSPHGPLYEISGPMKHPDAKLIRGPDTFPVSDWVLTARSIPEAKIVRSDLLLDEQCRKSATVVTHHFGVNLAVSGLARLNAPDLVPDLDVFAKVSFDVNRTARTLDIEAKVFGDKFPNCEAFIEDEAGTRVFLGVFRRVGYPVNKYMHSTLTGVKTDLMFTSQLKFALDESGAILKFFSGVPIKPWNDKLAAYDKNATDLPTEFTRK